MKIKINKLFGKFDNEIDLENKCTIFIGENGIGKSTTLNIINCILNKEFDKIPKYYFESICIDDIEIFYREFVPSINDIGDYFRKFEDESLREVTNQMFPSDGFEYILCKFDEDSYYEFMRALFNDSYTIEQRKLITFELSLIAYICADSFENFVLSLKKTIQELLDNKQTDFYKSKNYLKVSKYCYNKTFKLNMVRDLKIINDEKLLENKIDNSIIVSHIVKNKSLLKYVCMDGVRTKKFIDKYNSIDEDEYVSSTMSSFDKIKKYNLFDDINNNNTINLSKVLFSMFYNRTNFEWVIRKYYNFVKNINFEIKQENFSEAAFYFRNPEHRFEVDNYLIPILPKNSLFDIYYDNYGRMESDLLREFNFEMSDFYGAYYSELNDNKIKSLQILFDKYFKNKKIIVTPTKIYISFDKDKYKNLDYNFLSDGEKKLIILFVVCVLNDDVILLLDEPETSLSIVWQETLISDLIKYTNLKNIIVATQSPYISNDDILEDSLHPLIDWE